MTERPARNIEAAADWINSQADYKDRKGFHWTAKRLREKADALFMSAYYLRKYGTVNPWA